jgi:hypothetical protein
MRGRQWYSGSRDVYLDAAGWGEVFSGLKRLSHEILPLASKVYVALICRPTTFGGFEVLFSLHTVSTKRRYFLTVIFKLHLV